MNYGRNSFQRFAKVTIDIYLFKLVSEDLKNNFRKGCILGKKNFIGERKQFGTIYAGKIAINTAILSLFE